jgi:ribosomal protein L19
MSRMKYTHLADLHVGDTVEVFKGGLVDSAGNPVNSVTGVVSQKRQQPESEDCTIRVSTTTSGDVEVRVRDRARVKLVARSR